MSHIDHYDIISGQPRSSRKLRTERWPETLQRIVNWLEGRIAKRRSRKRLMALDERLLQDIGKTRKEALEEGQRSFLD